MKSTRTRSQRIARTAILAGLLALAAPAAGTQTAESGGNTQVTDTSSKLAPARRATWDNIDRRGRSVPIEVGAGGGWYFWPPVLQWRYMDPADWATSDPIFEVMLYPPYSGSATNAESFFLQVPTTNIVPVADRGMVIGFHGYELSPSQIFGVKAMSTDLPEYCTQNGWFLLAPTGILTTNMGSLPSQRALEMALALIVGLFDFNWDKMYSMGFSAGALSAASFAMRHLDPGALLPAGIIYHTGTIDLIREYNQQSAQTQTLWAGPDHFGDTFANDPFAYHRVNNARFNAAGDDFSDDHFAFKSLKHVPFYLHVNLNDPTHLPGWNMELEEKFSSDGFTYRAVTGSTATPKHTIHSIDYPDALAYISQFEAGPLPTSAELFADRPAKYLWSKMISDPAPEVARYAVDIDAPANSFDISDTHHVGILGFDLALMGLDPLQVLNFTAASGDSTSDTYVLIGYPAAPSSVLVDGVAPVSWSYDPVKAEVSITPNSSGGVATVQVIP
ncbi:MAG: hypothetical protein AAF682_28460 [Planctomycetota bacterium]